MVLPLGIVIDCILGLLACVHARNEWLKVGLIPADVPRLVKHVDESFLRQARALALPVDQLPCSIMWLFVMKALAPRLRACCLPP